MQECSTAGGREVNIIVFGKEDVSDILTPLGYEIKGYKIYKDDQTVRCNCCNKELHVDRLGNILPGSDLLYCKEASCFAEYMRTKMGL